MLQKLVFKPGANRENTNYANEGGWYDMDKVRFRFGTPEKIGGWRVTGTDTYHGTARKLMGWSSMSGEQMLGIGTNTRFYVEHGGVFNNITPLRSTSSQENPFTTTSGSTVMRVTHPQHGAKVGDWVSFTGASDVGGVSAATLIDPDGYRVLSIIDDNTYTFAIPLPASSTATGGGTVTIQYELGSGLAVFSTGNGWGAGYWNGPILGNAVTTLAGAGAFALNSTDTTINVLSTSGFTAAGQILIGNEVIAYTGTTSTSFTGCTRGSNGSMARNHTRRMVSHNGTDYTYEDIYPRQIVGFTGETGWGETSDNTFTVGTQMRLWTADPYGEDLIFAPRGGSIFYWTKDTNAFARSASLRNSADATLQYVPHTVNQVMVSDVSRFVIALGANPYVSGNSFTDFDPMLVRWSAQELPSNWIPTAENQAGEQRLSTGAYIVCGHAMKQEVLIWTDSALYSMQYIGPPYVFRLDLVMSNLSIMGPNCVALVNNAAFWMGTDKFYIYNGKVDTLPCTLTQYIFNDLAFEQRFQCFAGTNEGFNEIWWFYVSTSEVATAASEAREPVCDKYVVFNHAENLWYFGSMKRTAWLDSPLHPGPLAAMKNAAGNGILVMHEQGTDDGSESTSTAIEAYVESTDFDIGDGHQFLFVTRVVPDVSFNGSVVPLPAVTLSLTPRQNPGAAYGTSRTGTVQSAQEYTPSTKQYLVQEFTQVIQTRLRGRQMSFRIESSDLGVQWKLGAPRIDARPDGRKS